jgi:RHS repeat-associated protein
MSSFYPYTLCSKDYDSTLTTYFLFYEWWFSPYINHFVSADTIVPGYTNPQSLNRYSYVANNPVRYTDPTGHMRVADGPVQDRFRKSVYHRYRSPRPQRGERERKDDSGSQQEDTDWLHNLAGNKYTPLGLAIVQDAASEVQSFGQGLEAAGFVTANPAAAATGGAIFDGGFWVGRIAGVLGTGDTIYQYYKNLNGTNGTDVYESITTTVIGIYPPLSTKAARFNTAYTFIRLSVDVPEIPFILPRK